ncbi:MAG: hypothetical protein JO250_11235 [Armatimonadetes bacterium]|nr:hypothetical protein [Armatimonadota bacterium]
MKRPHWPTAVCLSFGLLAAVTGVAAADLFAGSSWSLLSPGGAAVLRTAPGQVLQVTVHHPLKAYYQIELTHDVAAVLPAGATVRYHFLARSPTRNPIHAVIEKRTSPYTHLFDKAITLTPAWKDYTFTTRIPSAYGPRGLAARLQVGQQAGIIEFKSISMTKG